MIDILLKNLQLDDLQRRKWFGPAKFGNHEITSFTVGVTSEMLFNFEYDPGFKYYVKLRDTQEDFNESFIP